jgi:hypothetical protein
MQHIHVLLAWVHFKRRCCLWMAVEACLYGSTRHVHDVLDLLATPHLCGTSLSMSPAVVLHIVVIEPPTIYVRLTKIRYYFDFFCYYFI